MPVEQPAVQTSTRQVPSKTRPAAGTAAMVSTLHVPQSLEAVHRVPKRGHSDNQLRSLTHTVPAPTAASFRSDVEENRDAGDCPFGMSADGASRPTPRHAKHTSQMQHSLGLSLSQTMPRHVRPNRRRQAVFIFEPVTGSVTSRQLHKATPKHHPQHGAQSPYVQGLTQQGHTTDVVQQG